MQLSLHSKVEQSQNTHSSHYLTPPVVAAGYAVSIQTLTCDCGLVVDSVGSMLSLHSEVELSCPKTLSSLHPVWKVSI